MFQNYLKIALRNLLKYKTYSFVNLAGLATGLASCMLIMGYIYNELSYDKFHERADRIFRITTELSFPENERKMATTSAPLAEELQKAYPEIENTVRFWRQGSRIPVQYEDKEFFEENYLFADQTVFDVFSFPMTRGNPKTALEAPSSAVITERLAKKYFGDVDPLDKVLRLNDRNDYKVTGVLQNVPENSHLAFDMLLSFESLYVNNQASVARRGNFRYHTYILLKEKANQAELERKFPHFVQQFFGMTEEQASNFHFVLQPLSSIHLHSNLNREISGNSDIKYVYIFSVIAFSILLIAMVNFMNLATARSATRSLEVGLRKVLGAEKRKLIQQFLGESIIFCLLALGVALLFVELAGPYFSTLTGSKLHLGYLELPWLVPGLIGLALVVGLFAGSYPAFFLASFKPLQVMKGGLKAGKAKARLRRILVVAQFAVSIVLIIFSLIAFSQLNFMRSKKLGFNKEQVIVMSLRGSINLSALAPSKELLKSHSGVLSVAASSHVPGLFYNTVGYLPEGFEQAILMKLINIDHDFIPTLGMEMAAGRNFSEVLASDPGSIIINETAAKLIGWDDPVGKKIRHDYGKGEVTRTVIGIVKDFNFASLHKKIEPLYISNETGWLTALSIRVSPERISETLDFVKKTWNDFLPNRAFDYFFLDDSFDSQYRADERLSRLFAYFAIFAIFIACLGLFGLASFTAEQRTKEVGVRKVLGATVVNVVTLLSKDFVKLVLLANLIAWPLAWLAINRWLL